jgi:hypothetical protein
MHAVKNLHNALALRENRKSAKEKYFPMFYEIRNSIVIPLKHH